MVRTHPAEKKKKKKNSGQSKQKKEQSQQVNGWSWGLFEKKWVLKKTHLVHSETLVFFYF